MTRGENTVIEKLRDELHACHLDVQKIVRGELRIGFLPFSSRRFRKPDRAHAERFGK